MIRTALILFALLLSVHLHAQMEGPFGGEPHQHDHVQCLNDDQRSSIITLLQTNEASLQEQGLIEARSSAIVFFDWPIRQADGFNYNSVYGISNFVDHNAINSDNNNNNTLDYNCGNRTYDVQGYNHRGTDIYLWPFSWNQMADDQAEIVAAAAGVIIAKQDGNPDMSCSFNVSTDWNAVYIRHADGSIAWYGHMKRNSTTSKPIGASVSQGEYLGVVGSSGISTGPHLHFEIWKDNTYSELIDPYQGSCNDLNQQSWWSDQQEYYEPTINHVSTHDDPPEFISCEEDNPNFQNQFDPGQTIYIAAYYKDQLPTELSTYQLILPNGVVADTWTHTGDFIYSSSYWYWSFSVPANGIMGDYIFSVELLGNRVEHTFRVGDPCAVFDAEVLVTNTSCNENNGAVTINVLRGVAPFQYDIGFGLTDDNMFSDLDFGDYTATVTEKHGCLFTENFTIDGSDALSASIDNLLLDCTNTTAQPNLVINGTMPYTYNWTGPNGFTSTDPIPLLDMAGTYNLEISDANDCETTTSFEVTSNTEIPVIDIEDFELTCTVASVQLAASIQNCSDDYLWTGPDGFSSTLENPEATVPGNYNLQVTCNNGCTASTDFEVIAIDYPDVDLGSDFNSCNDSETLDAGNPGATYQWSNGETTQTIDIVSSGTYSVIVTNSQMCQESDEINIDFSAQPTAGFSVLSTGAAIDFTDESTNGPVQWMWDFGDGNTSTQQNPSHTYSQSGMYNVCLTVTNECGDHTTCMEVDLSTSINPIQGLVSFDIAPNPAQDYLSVQLTVESVTNFRFELIDLNGKTMWSDERNEQKIQLEIPLKEFASGAYFLRIKTKEGELVEKIIVE